MLKKMDARGVNMCTLTQTNPHVLWAHPEFGLELAQAINDSSSALCAKHPTRFTAALTLPMQSVHASLLELERARRLPGMRAVNITENINGRNIGSKEFWPVYEAIEAANLPIFLHNVDPFSQRMIEEDYSMINVLGNPYEATIAATSLVLSGTLDQFPKLDVYFPHAGGVLRVRHAADGLVDGDVGVFTARPDEGVRQSEAAACQRLPPPLPLRPDPARSEDHPDADGPRGRGSDRVRHRLPAGDGGDGPGRVRREDPEHHPERGGADPVRQPGAPVAAAAQGPIG